MPCGLPTDETIPLGRYGKSNIGRSKSVYRMGLGARMVLVGRPFNYAAAVAGEAGVLHAIALLRAEVDRNLAMLGATRCSELGPEHLLRRRG